jgi:hypothetical protein
MLDAGDGLFSGGRGRIAKVGGMLYSGLGGVAMRGSGWPACGRVLDHRSSTSGRGHERKGAQAEGGTSGRGPERKKAQAEEGGIQHERKRLLVAVFGVAVGV